MNRMTMTKLLKNIIDLYVENKFTYIYIMDVLDNIDNELFDEDKNAYLQAQLISTLFEQFPYYRLLKDLNDLGDYIIESSKGNPNYKKISKLLKNGCLADMIPDIKRRVQTETMAHVLELLYIYNHGELNSELVLNHLIKNMYDPNLLTSMDVADGMNYIQTSLPEVGTKKVSLRESISKSNATRKDNVRRKLEEYTINSFNEETLEDFFVKVHNIIDNSNLRDKELLRITINESLTNLFSKAVITWDQRKEDSNQLSLNFL